MRSLLIALFILTFASPAFAHDTGEEHEHDFGKPRTKGVIGITGAFGGLIGPSLGGDYEECEAPTNCSDRKRPFSTYLEGRLSYQLPATALGFEVGIGYIGGLGMRVTRDTTLLGEQNTPVSVHITDDVRVSGAFAVVGVSYAFIQKPVVFAGALSAGNWWAELETTRTGTAVTAAPPSPREMKGASKEEKANMLLVIPEVRLAYPVLPNLQVGLSLGGFFTFGEARPKVVQTPVATPTDTQPAVPGGGAIGFVPQTNATPQSAMDSPILFRSALFVSGVF
jgi:hypothetical protein